MFSHALRPLAPWLLGVALATSGFSMEAAPAGAGTLDATWTAPTTNADSSPLTDLAWYRFYYGTSTSPCPGASYVAIPSSAPIPAAGETVAVTITGLKAGMLYYASVTAVDITGNESACVAPAQTATARIDFSVSPTGTTNFGSVPVGGLADRTFTVQNTGGGTISGTVATSAPFTVVAGASFSLASVGSTHVVTVRFRPIVSAAVSANVNFTTASGDTISRVVTGTGSTGDTTVPTVAITGPTTAASYSTSSLSVALSGTAADNIGVSQVTWANSQGGSGTASGTTAWTAGGVVLQTGTNVLTVTAHDGAGNTATDTLTVTVTASTDTTPPTVALTAPMSGSTVSGTITVSASAVDDVSVAGVQFKLDGVNLGVEVTAPPYTVSWNTTTATGEAHSLTAVARDAAGNTATSAAAIVTVSSVTTSVLLSNGSFETFTGSVATGWTLVTDGGGSVTAAKASGLTGLGQRITIAAAGGWFYLYQKPAFKLNQTYEWTFSYRTSGANTVWAQVSDSTVSNLVLSEELPGTNGVWKQRTLTFTYTNALANQLKMVSNAVGSIWLDGFSLREVDAPLLSNGSFESFTGKVATGWKFTKDGIISASIAKATGLTGLGQKIVIASAGTWGLYLHQQVVLKLNAHYEWTFSYKTSGANTVWAQITDSTVGNLVLSEELPGTNGVWKQRTLTFTYTNARADLVRMASDAVGSIWLDGFSLREVGAPIVANGNFEFFSNSVATGWRVTADGVVGATVAKASGHGGYGQRIDITSPGAWGLYFHQRLVLKVGARYEWTFWYKTSGVNTVWAQVSDSTVSNLVLSEELPGTNRVWTQRTLTFTYTNARADLLRMASDAVGSIWLDGFSLRETAP
jgi:Big-like domain-containing protein